MICDCCKKNWSGGMRSHCPHPNAKEKGIKRICYYCCIKCKYSKRVGSGIDCTLWTKGLNK